MRPGFYALSATDGSFVVYAETAADLVDCLDNIRERFPMFYRQFCLKGLLVVEATSVRDAKLRLRGNNATLYYEDLPLFRSALQSAGIHNAA